MGTYRPDPKDVHFGDGEVLDEVDELLAELDQQVIDRAEGAIGELGAAIGDAAMARGIKLLKPIRDFSAETGLDIGRLAGEWLKGATQSPPEDEEG